MAINSIDWMHPEVGAADPTAADRWINRRTWDFLLSGFADDPVDPALLSVAGSMAADGSLDVEPAYEFEGNIDGDVGDEGDVQIEQLDVAGNVLARAGVLAVEQSVAVGEDEEQTAPMAPTFSARVAAAPGATRLRVTHAGGTYERVRTPAAPAVTVVGPNGGESFAVGDDVRIDWEASDADGDALVGTVSLSLDGGATWRPLAADVAASSLTFTATQEMATEEAVLRVRTTDGWNTSEDVSDAPFAIVGKLGPGRVAFTRQAEREIFTAEPDGTDVRRATNFTASGGYALTSSWSPDGTRLAVAAHPGSSSSTRLYVVEPGTGTTTQILPNSVTKVLAITCPQWVPDGRILFMAEEYINGAYRRAIYIANDDGSGVQRLVEGKHTGNQYGVFTSDCPKLSPDGTTITLTLFVGGWLQRAEVHTIGIDGSGLTRLTFAYPDPSFNPTWSPDGTRILFSRWTDADPDAQHNGYEVDLWTMAPDGSDQRRLTERTHAHADFQPMYSFDGRHIVFAQSSYHACACDDPGYDDTRIVVIDTDGGNERWVTVDAALRDTDPSWAVGSVAGAEPRLRAFVDAPASAVEGQAVTLVARRSFSDSGIASLEWDLDGDGLFDDATGPTASFTPPDDGTYAVSVLLTDRSGRIASGTALIAVANRTPAMEHHSAYVGPSGSVVLRARLFDAPSDTHEVTVDWQDGSPVERVPVVEQGGLRYIQASHHYDAAPPWALSPRVVDDDGGVLLGFVLVEPRPSNGAPTLAGVSVGVPEGGSRLVTLDASDPDGDGLTFDVVASPQHGQLLRLDGADRTTAAPRYLYVPDPGYAGPDEARIVASDGATASKEAVISISVLADTELLAAPVVGVPGPEGVSIAEVRATLRRATTGAPISGRRVFFSAGEIDLCSAVTDANGIARCGPVEAALAVLASGYTATFRGDERHSGSSDTAEVLVVGSLTM